MSPSTERRYRLSMRAGWCVWGLGVALFAVSLPLETGDDVLGWLGFALVVAGGVWMVQVNKRHFAEPPAPPGSRP